MAEPAAHIIAGFDPKCVIFTMGKLCVFTEGHLYLEQ